VRLSPESKAQEVLNETKTDVFPVDVFKLAEAYKIKIIKAELPDNISGMLHKESHVIFVNKKDPDNRQRFTIAHELGHFFMSTITGIHVDKQVGFVFRDDKSNKALYTSEISANKFAAELLMPTACIATEIKKLLKQALSVEEIIDKLSKKFEVSELAMSYKLKNLGIII
jgi:Zn-dependent peptidase ImmA (M78 family)